LETLNHELLEKVKISFFDIDNLIGLININLVGFILLTMALLFYISERFFLITIDSFYTEAEDPTKTGIYIAYKFFRKAFLYGGLIIMSVILVYRNVWLVSLEEYVSVFSLPMLFGFILVLASVVVNLIKSIEGKLKSLVSLGLLVAGYIVYGMGLVMGLNLY
jgi:hypothetical protein